MGRRTVPHVGMRNSDLVCHHCGSRYTPALPCSVEMWAAIVNTFKREHKNCVKPESAEGRQA